MHQKRNNAVKYWLTAAILVVFVVYSLLSKSHFFMTHVFETGPRMILAALQQLCIIACGVYCVLVTVVSLKDLTKNGMISTIVCAAVILVLILVIRFAVIIQLFDSYAYLVTSLCGLITVLIVQYIRYRKIDKEHKSTE